LAKKTDDEAQQPDFGKFESYLDELERLVERMEQGDQTLEQSLKDFERGVTLTKTCEKTLKQAEQRVSQLVKKHGDLNLEPFTREE